MNTEQKPLVRDIDTGQTQTSWYSGRQRDTDPESYNRKITERAETIKYTERRHKEESTRIETSPQSWLNYSKGRFFDSFP